MSSPIMRIWAPAAALVLLAAAHADEGVPDHQAAREIARAAPASDIWLVTLARDEAGPRLGEPRNVTQRPGYDNQPAFLPDGRRFYYASIYEGLQADVFCYDIDGDAHRRLTATPESEFSPTPLPEGSGFAAVRVEADGIQRLWRFDPQGGEPRLIPGGIGGVGYYAWIDAQQVALFVLGEPPGLALLNLEIGAARVLATGVGRSLQKVPNRSWIAYVERRPEQPDWIRVLRLPSGLQTPLTPVVEGSEDFVMGTDGDLYMASGRALFVWQREPGSWRRLAEFAGLPGAISRIALNPQADLFALVVAEQAGSHEETR